MWNVLLVGAGRTPVGCSGARIVTTLLHEMKRRDARYGIAAMCVGGGQGIGCLIENRN